MQDVCRFPVLLHMPMSLSEHHLTNGLTGPSSNNAWNNEQGWRDSINRENHIASKSLVVSTCSSSVCAWPLVMYASRCALLI